MARIPNDELERLKREVSVERLALARGVELKRHGTDLIGLCPFHEDKSPSLVITPSKNLWHCLGACCRGGSVVDWVMKAEGVSFRHAVELLRADLPGSSVSSSTAKRSSVKRLPPPVEPHAGDPELLRQVVGYYHEQLKQSPEAQAYLQKRGLVSSEMVERFQLGFANRTLCYRLPDANRKAGAEIRGRLAKLGILRESGHEHFSGSLVIPILGEAGTVLGMYGRKITEALRPGTPLHLYLPGPHQGVWNVSALSADGTVILCEALIDALTFWCAGYRNVTASYGVEGFTQDHLSAFERCGVREVLIAYDRDDAGDGAAEALAKKLVLRGMSCSRVQFPKGMDANEYALKVQPAPKSLGLLLRHAVWMGGVPRVENKPEIPEPLVPSPSPPSLPLAASAEPTQEAARPDLSLRSAPGLPAKPPPAAAEAPAASEPISAPAPRPPEVPAVVTEEEVLIQLGDRRYRVRGLGKNLSYDSLKVNVLSSRSEGAFHVDTFDLYSAKARAGYVKQASIELGVAEDVVKADLGKVLFRLEQLQEEQIEKALLPAKKEVSLTEEERQAALDLLREPRLLDRILDDFTRCGLVGEETNKLVGYLAAVSRKLDEPLAVIIQSSSAAGKTSLMDAVLSLVPEEERVKYSAMTGQSLFYLGETDLSHKILAIVEEEGAARAAYALKLLQSEGELTIASTGKDPATGRLVTHEYRVEGPVMIFLSTTAIELSDELLNRCLVLTVDEDREQTRAIHRLQRKKQTLEGLFAEKQSERVLKVHQDAQRLLSPIAVVNPYADQLTFLDDRTRTRRDHLKYLTLIRAIALLHQYQRPVKTAGQGAEAISYVEVVPSDIAVANRLAHQVLGRSLDELPPQTRRLLLAIDEMVRASCERLKVEKSDFRFSRREVREHVRWGNTQLKVHLSRLEELEYVVSHRASRGNGLVYELLYDGAGKDGTPFLCGLIDAGRLSAFSYEQSRSGVLEEKSGSGRPLVGPESGGGRGAEIESHAPAAPGPLANRPSEPKNSHPGSLTNGPSYANGSRSRALRSGA